MKVLLLAPHPYYIPRGTPIDVDILLRALSGRGESVDVVTYHEGEDRGYENVQLHRISAGWLKSISPGFSWKKVLCDVLLAVRAWRLVRRNRYDLVHAGEEAVFIAMTLRALYGIPYVYDMDSSVAQQIVEMIPVLTPLAPILDRLEARAIRGSIAAAPVCNALADLARERNAPHVVTLHDISQLVRSTSVDAGANLPYRRQDDDTIVIMYAGNLQKYQGIDLLLESFALACSEMPTLELVIVGGTPEHVQKYRRKADQLGIAEKTHFLGERPIEELSRLFDQADILAAPRIKGINTPMKIFPYLHSGKAVLVTDLPTHSQILDDSVALLAPAHARGFSKQMVRLARDPELRRRLGKRGEAFVERNHTFRAHRRRVDALYDYLERELSQRSARSLSSKSAQPGAEARATGA